jgi:hypothetical protein
MLLDIRRPKAGVGMMPKNLFDAYLQPQSLSYHCSYAVSLNHGNAMFPPEDTIKRALENPASGSILPTKFAVLQVFLRPPRLRSCVNVQRYRTLGHMIGSRRDPCERLRPEERPLFPHPPWMVGIVLMFGLVAVIAGLSDPIWFLLGAPFVLALVLYLYARITVRKRENKLPDSRDKAP